MWKLLFPRWFVVVGLFGLIIMAVASIIFWLMLAYLPVSSGRIFPRGILLPILFGAAGGLIFLIILGEWLIFRMLPLLNLVSRSGWRVGLLKYKREHCDHVWVYDPENNAIRTCSMCEHHERRESVPYFTGGEISYGWYPQNPDELRFR